MHEVISEVLRVWHFIRHGGETGETLFVDVYAQWVNTIQQNVYAEIKLKAINEERLLNIALGDLVL